MTLEFWRLLIKEYGHLRLASLICAVTIAIALLEGLNIGLLVPLLETLDSPEQGAGHWVAQAFARLFHALGLAYSLETILLSLAALVLALGLLKYLRMVLVARMRVGFLNWLRSRAMSNLLHADMAYFHGQRLGVLTDTLTTQANLAAHAILDITEIAAVLVIIAVYLAGAFLISPLLTAVAFGILLLVVIAMQFHIARARAIGASQVQRNQELHSAAVESLSGIRVIKSFLLERSRWLEFSRKAQDVGDELYRMEQNRSQMVVLQEIALFALIGGIVFVGVAVLGMDIAVTVALLFILYRLAPRVSSLNTMRQSLAANIASLRSVKKTIDETATPRIASGAKPFTGLESGIELRKVCFSYNGSSPVLQDAEFIIEKGKMTALVGTSGAGKSTLVDLLLRYYDPAQGRILVDGVDLRELDLASWRKSIGLVSQDVFLFNDTIASNIAMGQGDAGMAQIIEATREAYAHDFIQQLPRGYETIVGDRGWNLSGGQRQRIALARAILRRPEILILDEATSSLDSESEQLVRRYVDSVRGACTIVVVAHRMSTIQSADKIAVLQDGKIVEEGDWDSLLARAGVFANYHRLQIGS